MRKNDSSYVDSMHRFGWVGLGWVGLGWVGLAQEQPLAGVIDIHVYSAPNSTPRSIDAIGLVRLAKAQGMRGVESGAPSAALLPTNRLPATNFLVE
jgi:hypothetical protein